MKRKGGKLSLLSLWKMHVTCHSRLMSGDDRMGCNNNTLYIGFCTVAIEWTPAPKLPLEYSSLCIYVCIIVCMCVCVRVYSYIS